jgi:hypothetical protein
VRHAAVKPRDVVYRHENGLRSRGHGSCPVVRSVAGVPGQVLRENVVGHAVTFLPRRFAEQRLPSEEHPTSMPGCASRTESVTNSVGSTESSLSGCSMIPTFVGC